MTLRRQEGVMRIVLANSPWLGRRWTAVGRGSIALTIGHRAGYGRERRRDVHRFRFFRLAIQVPINNHTTIRANRRATGSRCWIFQLDTRVGGNDNNVDRDDDGLPVGACRGKLIRKRTHPSSFAMSFTFHRFTSITGKSTDGLTRNLSDEEPPSFFLEKSKTPTAFDSESVNIVKNNIICIHLSLINFSTK